LLCPGDGLTCQQCNSASTNKYLKYDDSNCISSCSIDFNTYANTSNTTNYKCILCNLNIPNCVTCTNSTNCLTCTNNSFLKSDNSICVASCIISDLGSCQDNTNFKCLRAGIITNCL